MGFLKKGKKKSLRNNKFGTLIKHSFPNGVETISHELVDGKDVLLTMMKYGTRKMDVEEHFNQKIKYQFYSEDEDFNYTIPHSELDDVFENLKTSKQEFISEMDDKWNPTILNWITEIKTQHLSKGKVDDTLIESMEILLRIYLKSHLIPLLKKVFKENPSFINPPQSLFKNNDLRSCDIMFKIKRMGDSVGIGFDINQFIPKEDDVWIDTVFSESNITTEEIVGLKSLGEERFESELNNLLKEKGINKN